MAGKRKSSKELASMKVGYVVSFDPKRGVGFIRSADDDTYDAAQLSKNYKVRAEQEQLVMFHSDAVQSEIPLLEGLKVRYDLTDAAPAEDALWRVAGEVVPDDAFSQVAAGTPADDTTGDTTGGAAPLSPTEVIEEAVAKAAAPSVKQADIRDVGFADEYGEDWDASSWDDDNRS